MNTTNRWRLTQGSSLELSETDEFPRTSLATFIPQGRNTSCTCASMFFECFQIADTTGNPHYKSIHGLSLSHF
jgi:hypothetical protein